MRNGHTGPGYRIIPLLFLPLCKDSTPPRTKTMVGPAVTLGEVSFFFFFFLAEKMKQRESGALDGFRVRKQLANGHLYTFYFGFPRIERISCYIFRPLSTIDRFPFFPCARLRGSSKSIQYSFLLQLSMFVELDNQYWYFFFLRQLRSFRRRDSTMQRHDCFF